MSSPPRALVLYDADCGLCSRSARLLRRLDRGRRLRLMALQDAGQIPGAPRIEVLIEAMHVRDRHGRWIVAGAAWLAIADEVPVLRPLAISARLAVVHALVDWAYSRVASNRQRLSRLLGVEACPMGGTEHDAGRGAPA